VTLKMSRHCPFMCACMLSLSLQFSAKLGTGEVITSVVDQDPVGWASY
jgi:hypothetical protein